MSDAPSWLSDDVPPSNGGSGGGSGPAQGKGNGLSDAEADKGEDGPTYKTIAQMTLAILNIGVCVFMAATGVLGISGAVKLGKEELEESSNDEIAVTDVFVGTYMILFALVLFCHEVAYVTKIEILNLIMKRNFGFLYGVIGKCCYIIFVAILVFGLSQPHKLVLACGITTAGWGPLQLLYYMRYPDHFDKVTKYDPREDGLAL